MSLLSWDQPQRLRPKAEHDAMYQSDSGIAGTYVPNMSDEDQEKWRAKYIGGKDPRVEIRTRAKPWTQVVLVVRPDRVKLSMNGSLEVDHEWPVQLYIAFQEARQRLGVTDED